ncbi:hypothetical protein [Psychrobacillus sp. FJAT-21963]|uniref:hypothetical protein n=1 Tax=Psychrobacillus sp. FJAT-21963 TaxID=1712028 RepID=UPI0006FF7E56|nr:hypothetical protein [Psychrobacillus sp. FJAT-21963]KQL12436.1 cardiolipin synthase [Psychrobacillus sp. FJAT-21963]
MLTKKSKKMAIVIPLAVVIGFGGYMTLSGQVHSLAGIEKEPQTVILSKDFPSTSDLNVMIDEADLVVIGHYNGLDSKWNMARNPNNPSQEDTENYVEGHLYNFKISETIKGASDSKQIQVNHRFAETVVLEVSDAVVSPEGIVTKEATKVDMKEIENKDPLFIEPANGKKYMLFLKKNEDLGSYYGAIEPFSISFDKNDKAELQTNIETIDEDSLTSQTQFAEETFIVKNEIHETITDTISGKSLKELIQQVQKNSN